VELLFRVVKQGQEALAQQVQLMQHQLQEQVVAEVVEDVVQLQE
jgi:hypothetical protein